MFFENEHETEACYVCLRGEEYQCGERESGRVSHWSLEAEGRGKGGSDTSFKSTASMTYRLLHPPQSHLTEFIRDLIIW